VLAEYKTYTRNKAMQGIVYDAVDDIRVYNFIDEIFSLPLNNQVHPFETVYEITSYLKEQWAGLFQRLLSEGSRQKEVNLIESLKATSKTLNQTVQYLVAEKDKGDHAIKEILLSNHPAFENVRQKLKINFRVFFQSKAELSQLMKALSYEEAKGDWDSQIKEGFLSWQKKDFSSEFIHISDNVFDKDGRLKPFTPLEWDEDWIQHEEDDIPF
jgi:hypothetical protein